MFLCAHEIANNSMTEHAQECVDDGSNHYKEMSQVLEKRRQQDRDIMSQLKVIKHTAVKKKKLKGSITLTAIKPLAGDLFLLDEHLLLIKTKLK